MQKYVPTLFIAMCFALMQKGDFKELSTNSTVESNIPTESVRKINATLRRGGRNNEIADENKSIRIIIREGAEFRVALDDERKIWENASVPFEISGDYNKDNRSFILEAMEEFHNKTCVRFIPRKEEKAYIFIEPGSGCSAAVGKGSQSITVSLSINCFVKGIVIHELMHTLGFLHEQNRPDRDKFVKIMFENIKKGFEDNFKKFPEDVVTAQNLTYDYGSLLHYGAFDFSKDNGSPTIIPLKKGVEIGQRDGFSELDIKKINLLYNCSATSNMENITTEDEGLLPSEDEDRRAKRKEKIKKNPILYFISKIF